MWLKYIYNVFYTMIENSLSSKNAVNNNISKIERKYKTASSRAQ